MKKKFIIISLLFFVSGMFLVLNSGVVITGAVIGVQSVLYGGGAFISGLICLALSIVIFLLNTSGSGDKIELRSAINKHKDLAKLANDAGKDQYVQLDLDRLSLQLSKGNLESGLGQQGHVSGTDIFYLRARNGGRLFYHKIYGGKTGKIIYEIVGKSSKVKNNEDKVIELIRKYYGK